MQNVFMKSRRSFVGDLLGTCERVGSMGSNLQLLDDLNKLIFTGDLYDCVGHLQNYLLLELLEVLLGQLRHGEEPGHLQFWIPAG